MEAAAKLRGFSGHPYDAMNAEPLTSITGGDIAKVLHRQGRGKDRGAYGWGAKELFAPQHRLPGAGLKRFDWIAMP